MRKLLILLALMSIIPLVGKGQLLSEQAEVSVLTYEPIEEIHAIFGHTAVRVYDPQNRIDILYNYGTFDFETPNFLMKFIRGKLLYALGIQDFRQLLSVYEYRNQTVYEQQLDLTLTQKQAVFNYLQNNFKPENRFYLYDFFFDNCATRIRDVFYETLGDSLSYEKTKVEQGKTLRQLLDEFIVHKPWLDFGIDLVLGLPSDQKADFDLQMFLPRYLYKGLTVGSITKQGIQKPLVKSTRTVYQAPKTESKVSFLTSPFFLFTLFFGVLTACLFFWRTARVTRILQGGILFFMGLAGLVLLLMWFGTDHQATQQNLNILWAFPTHLIAAFWFWRNRIPRYAKSYFLVSAVLNILLLLSWSFFPQQFHLAVIPLMLCVVVIAVQMMKKI